MRRTYIKDGRKVGPDQAPDRNEQTFQMAFIHHNDVIQLISSAAFNPTLCYTIPPWAFEGRSYRTHLQERSSARMPLATDIADMAQLKI